MKDANVQQISEDRSGGSVCVCVCVSLTHNQGYVAALRTHLTCNILLPSHRNVSYLRSSTEQTPGLNVHIAH